MTPPRAWCSCGGPAVFQRRWRYRGQAPSPWMNTCAGCLADLELTTLMDGNHARGATVEISGTPVPPPEPTAGMASIQAGIDAELGLR